MTGGSRIDGVIWLGNRIAYRFVNLFSRAGLNGAVRRAVAELEAMEAPQRVMSVGAGGRLGGLVKGLRNGTVVEVDIDATRAPDIVADICAMQEIADASFDAIFALEVLEHVPEPRDAVSELHRVLRPGGRIMVSTPFLFEIHEAPDDYYRYTRHGLVHLFRDFADVEIHGRNGYVFSILTPGLRLIMSRYATDVLLAWAFCLVVLALWPLLWLLDRCVRSDAVATGYVLCARKPSGSTGQATGDERRGREMKREIVCRNDYDPKP